MSTQPCRYDREIGIAATLSPRTPSLERHLRNCEACQRTATSLDLLRHSVSTAPSPTTLPSASQIWWRHQLARRFQRREAAARQLNRRLAWAEAGGAATLLLGGGTLLAFFGGTGTGPSLLATAVFGSLLLSAAAATLLFLLGDAG